VDSPHDPTRFVRHSFLIEQTLQIEKLIGAALETMPDSLPSSSPRAA
jgi:hypothetical protein